MTRSKKCVSPIRDSLRPELLALKAHSVFDTTTLFAPRLESILAPPASSPIRLGVVVSSHALRMGVFGYFEEHCSKAVEYTAVVGENDLISNIGLRSATNSFCAKVAQRKGGALLLDYDGTLAPFSTDRDSALPYPQIREMLSKIIATGGTRVVVISGRPAGDVVGLLGVRPPPEVWGVHGLERLRPDGSSESVHLQTQERDALDQARTSLEYLGLRHLTELKPGSVAVHWRGLAADDATRVRNQVSEAWNRLPTGGTTIIQEFDGGLEIRVARKNKGDAVRTILSEVGPDIPVAYLGDDRTDEDAFRALKGTGLTILVRPEWRETNADLWIRPPDELLDFLRAWLSACGGEA
jgi:trehalose 6-phosphate phosphatase